LSDGKHYGWVIVATMLLVQTISSGFGFYNMSVYVAEFAELMNRPVSDLSLAVSVFFLTGGVFGLYVANLINRFEIRWIMVVGALICSVALAGMSLVTKIWQVYALFMLFGLGNTGISLIIATTLITRWFPGPDRSIALSVSSSGLSLGGVTLTPLTAYLFNNMGVYESLPFLGLSFALVIIPLAIFFVRLPRPVEVVADTQSEESQLSYAQAIRSSFFCRNSIGYALCMLAQVGGIAHLYGRLDIIGDYQVASRAVASLSMASIVFRILGGWIVTRLALRTFTLCMLVVQAIGLTMIGLAEAAWQGIVAAAVLGASVGNLLMSQPLWLAEVFPGVIYPRVFALASALSVVGIAIGPYLLGLIIDRTGYEAAYVSAAGGCVLAWVLIYLSTKGPKMELQNSSVVQ